MVGNREDTSFDFYGGVGCLVENAPHVAVALRGPMVVVHAGALAIAGAGAHPRGEVLVRRKGRSSGTYFGNNLGR
jgi:hypothetical protein